MTKDTGTTNAFIFQMINSWIESWRVRLTCFDCKYGHLMPNSMKKKNLAKGDFLVFFIENNKKRNLQQKYILVSSRSHILRWHVNSGNLTGCDSKPVNGTHPSWLPSHTQNFPTNGFFLELLQLMTNLLGKNSGARGQFNKTFTSVIYKCGYYFHSLKQYSRV